MKSSSLIITFVLLLSVQSQSFDYLADIGSYFDGLGNATGVDTTSFISCFNHKSAQFYLESLGLTYEFVFGFQNSNYPLINIIGDWLSNVTSALETEFQCLANNSNGEALNLALWGTNSIPIINAMQQAFLFDHTQDYLDLTYNVFDQMNSKNFYAAGILQAEVIITARYLVDEVGIAREIFNIVQTGYLFAFNLTLPSQALLCADEAQAQLSLDNLAQFSYIVSQSDSQSLIQNIETFEQQNVGLMDLLYPVNECYQGLPEYAAYEAALGYDTETSEWAEAVWNFIEEDPETFIYIFNEVGVMLGAQSYIGAGIFLSSLNEIVADTLNEDSKSKQ